MVLTADPIVLLKKRRCLRVKGFPVDLVKINERLCLWGLRIEVTNGNVSIAILGFFLKYTSLKKIQEKEEGNGRER